RIAAEQAPVLAAQDLPQVGDIAVDRFQVRIGAAVEVLEVAVGGAEVPVQALRPDFRDELGRLSQQIQARGVLDLATAVRRERQGDAAQHELGIEPVPAFLQVAAIGHLADHVGGADQVSEHDVARVRDPGLDLRERHLVTGEMDDLARHRRTVAEAEDRQELLQETRSTRDVGAGEFSAVAGLALIDAAQVADVVEQTNDQAHQRALPSQAGFLARLALESNDQARQSQRDVQRVLAVVIDGIDAEVARNLAGEQALEMLESQAQRIQGLLRPRRPVESLDRSEHRLRRAHLDGIGHVEIASPGVGHYRRRYRLAGTDLFDPGSLGRARTAQQRRGAHFRQCFYRCGAWQGGKGDGKLYGPAWAGDVPWPAATRRAARGVVAAAAGAVRRVSRSAGRRTCAGYGGRAPAIRRQTRGPGPTASRRRPTPTTAGQWSPRRP